MVAFKGAPSNVTVGGRIQGMWVLMPIAADEHLAIVGSRG